MIPDNKYVKLVIILAKLALALVQQTNVLLVQHQQIEMIKRPQIINALVIMVIMIIILKYANNVIFHATVVKVETQKIIAQSVQLMFLDRI